MSEKKCKALGLDDSENEIVVPLGAMQQQDSDGKPETKMTGVVINLGLLPILQEISRLKKEGKTIGPDTLPGVVILKTVEAKSKGSKVKEDKGSGRGE